MLSLGGLRPFLRHCNYATPEGLAFCTMLRGALHKKPRSKFKDRMTWPWYNEIAERYGILHKGGWAAYEPKRDEETIPEQNAAEASPAEASPAKRANLSPMDLEPRGVPQEAPLPEPFEEECMICLDRPATTLVWPCEHKVVCAECSERLEHSPDNRICVRCRRPISHVFYASGKAVEIK